MKIQIAVSLFAAVATPLFAVGHAPSISGEYLEVRSCDVYTGPCFANAEMGLAGREGMLFWSVKQGAWKGVDLSGLGVMAVVKTDATLGNLKYQPRSGDAVLIVDAKATSQQKDALRDFAREMSGQLIGKVIAVHSAPIEAELGTCKKAGCSSVKAGDLVEITTSCMSSKHDVCGNEETFYPPLSKVEGAYPVFTEIASYNGSDLDRTWQIAGKRSAFLATFAVDSQGGASKADLAQK